VLIQFDFRDSEAPGDLVLRLVADQLQGDRTAFGPRGRYVEELAERIKTLPSGRRKNPYSLVSQLLRATFDFTSERA
jgi:hypothetical protein